MQNVINLSSTTPAAPAGRNNVLWQNDSSTPPNVSAYVPFKFCRRLISGGNPITFTPTFSALNGLTTWAACLWINVLNYVSSATNASVSIGTSGSAQVGFFSTGESGTAFWTSVGSGGTVYYNMTGWANGANMCGWYFTAITCTSNAVSIYWKSYSAATLTAGGTGTASALSTATTGVIANSSPVVCFDVHDVMFFSQALTQANFLSIASTPANASSIAGSNLKFWAPLNGSNPETDSSGNGYSCSTMDPWVALLSLS